MVVQNVKRALLLQASSLLIHMVEERRLLDGKFRVSGLE